MNQCNSCGRHHHQEENSCPFCGRESRIGRLATKMTLVFTPMMLGACYGVPPTDWDTGLPDADADGYQVDEDCDDYDASVHPGAQEVCGDELDNDCDDQVDEPDDCVDD